MTALAGAEGAFLPARGEGAAEVVDFALEKLKRRAGGELPPLRLSAPDGRGVDLPPALAEVLFAAAELAAAGKAVALTAVGDTLTTSEAAKLLGVSRPTVVRWLEEGRIPYEQPGTHRRIRLADLIHYQQERKREQQRVLGQMVAQDLEDGLYDA